MNDSPKPSKKPAPMPSVARDGAHAIVAGMGIVRKPLFSSPITHEGWQKLMLTHINAAKQLGFTMFEIDTVEATVPRPKKKKEGQTGYVISSSMFGFVQQQVEGDEWKIADPATEEPEPSDSMMRTLVVRVYALAVE